MNDHKTSTPTLVSALRILAGEIQSDDGVANMTIAEAADRIEELVEYYGEALALERNRAEQAEQRNVELVAALTDIHSAAMVDGFTEEAPDMVCKIHELATKALARAESATPDHIPDAAKMVSATPAKHCEDCAPEFGCWDGGESCYKQPLQSSTPAKHPDTELLDWLFGNTIIAGPDGHVIDCRDDANAARKQGGAT